MLWDLSPLYSSFDDPIFQKDLQWIETFSLDMLNKAKNADRDNNQAEQVQNFVTDLIQLSNRAYRLTQFVYLTLSTNATDSTALLHRAQVDKQRIVLEQILSAIGRYLDSLDDFDAVINSSPLLKENRFALDELKNKAKHSPAPDLEPWLLRMRLSGGYAWEHLRDILTATLQIPFEKDGESCMLPLSEIRNFAYAEDMQLRKKAYDAELNAYKQIEVSITAALNGIKGEALTISEVCQYDSVLSMMLDKSRMDHETLSAMLSAIQESLPMFRRYLRAKARMLGYEGGLKFYDLFAPISGNARKFSPEEARAYLMDVLGSFSQRMRSFVDRAFEERWIDLFPRSGKQGGAFCSSNHELKRSWLLTNFDGNFNSICTLGHELGHAFHNDCVCEKPLLLSDYPMQLAETASIFNETIITRKAIADSAPAEALSILEASIMDATQVIVDIFSRYLFETEVIETRKDHEMTPDDLKDAMVRAQLESYGDGLDPEYLHPYMWANKSHYYMSDYHFYNFPYAFGLLFGLGVYAQYEKTGEAFVPVYEKLLAETGGDTVANVAASVGIDVRDPAFWRSSLSVIKSEIDLFEKLINEKLAQ